MRSVRLVAFRIERFRSLVDTGKCFTASDITVLAGKNESGKTNILRALGLLNVQESFADGDLPFQCEGNPVLSFWFAMTKRDEKRLSEELGIEVPLEGKELLAVREYGVGDVTYSGAAFEALLEVCRPVERSKRVSDIAVGLKTFAETYGDYFPLAEVVLETPEDVLGAPSAYRQAADASDPSADAWEADLSHLEAMVAALASSPDDRVVRSALYSYCVPRPIYFDSFADELPDYVAIDDVLGGKARIVAAFCSLAGLDCARIRQVAPDDRPQRAQLATLGSESYMKRFRPCWSQEDVAMSVSIDGDHLVFMVKSANLSKPFSPSQRSKGFRWFTSFFITVASRTDDFGEGTLILIDEPGLYLHAKAQSEVLDFLQEVAADSQVIFTTHSPYLLDPNRLDRIRLVLKDERGATVLRNSPFHGADEDSLTPVVTAIGLDVSRSWGTAKLKNLVVEGPSDYHYVSAAMLLLDVGSTIKNGDLAIVPCIGHTKAATMVSLLLGWGLEVCVLLDAKGTKQTQAKILQFGLPRELVMTAGRGDESVEDLLSTDDFEHLVAKTGRESTRPVGASNSEWIRQHGLNKLALSRVFAQHIREGTVDCSAATRKNFKELAGRICVALKL